MKKAETNPALLDLHSYLLLSVLKLTSEMQIFESTVRLGQKKHSKEDYPQTIAMQCVCQFWSQALEMIAKFTEEKSVGEYFEALDQLLTAEQIVSEIRGERDVFYGLLQGKVFVERINKVVDEGIKEKQSIMTGLLKENEAVCEEIRGYAKRKQELEEEILRLLQ
jgi:hypothetical protein